MSIKETQIVPFFTCFSVVFYYILKAIQYLQLTFIEKTRLKTSVQYGNRPGAQLRIYLKMISFFVWVTYIPILWLDRRSSGNAGDQ